MKSTGVPAEQQKLFSEGLRNKGVCCVCFSQKKNKALEGLWDGDVILKLVLSPKSAIGFRMVMHRHCRIPRIVYMLLMLMMMMMMMLLLLLLLSLSLYRLNHCKVKRRAIYGVPLPALTNKNTRWWWLPHSQHSCLAAKRGGGVGSKTGPQQKK